MRFTQKIASVFTLLALLFAPNATLALASQPPATQAIAGSDYLLGQLIKCASDSRVYVVAQSPYVNGVTQPEKRWLPNEAVFNSHGYSFEFVSEVSCADLNGMQSGKDVVMGSGLVQFSDSPEVYAVQTEFAAYPTGGALRTFRLEHIVNEATANYLFGQTWSTQIHSLPASDRTGYSVIDRPATETGSVALDFANNEFPTNLQLTGDATAQIESEVLTIMNTTAGFDQPYTSAMPADQLKYRVTYPFNTGVPYTFTFCARYEGPSETLSIGVDHYGTWTGSEFYKVNDAYGQPEQNYTVSGDWACFNTIRSTTTYAPGYSAYNYAPSKDEFAIMFGDLPVGAKLYLDNLSVAEQI